MGIKIEFWENWLDKLKEKSPVRAEVAKQALDQTLHILMAVASVWVLGCPIATLMGAPIWVAALVSGVLTAAWMGYREYTQWPSKRWWDPVMDWVFEAGGLALGLWSLIAVLG